MMISCIHMYKWGFDEALSVPSLVFLYNIERTVKKPHPVPLPTLRSSERIRSMVFANNNTSTNNGFISQSLIYAARVPCS
jgi:hypothetical protein